MKKIEPPVSAIPATVLTGFLGAGKTTFLNYILKEQKDLKVAVIINEMGAVNIDGGLIETSDESVVEMSNGCICCTVRADLLQSILKLIKKSKFDYLVIEPTGIADPGPIAQTFLNVVELQPYVKLDSIICLVDALNFFDHCKISPTTESQVEMADFIILNKIDIAPPEILHAVEKRIKELNPHATIHHAEHGKIDLAQIWDVKAFDPKHIPYNPMDLLKHEDEHEHHHHDDDIQSKTLIFDQPFNPQLFETLLTELSKRCHIIRSKGILYLNDQERRAIFHGVNDRYSLYWDRPWKKGEPKQSQLVFIGKDVPFDDIENNLRKCLEPLSVKA
jgi:G3E family GTPase